MEIERVSNIAKKMEKFSKEVLIRCILKHCWQINMNELLREMRFMTWEIRSNENLKLIEKEDAETAMLTEKLKKMPRNTTEEQLAYLRAEGRLLKLFHKHIELQDKREKTLDRLYKAIDGGE